MIKFERKKIYINIVTSATPKVNKSRILIIPFSPDSKDVVEPGMYLPLIKVNIKKEERFVAVKS